MLSSELPAAVDDASAQLVNEAPAQLIEAAPAQEEILVQSIDEIQSQVVEESPAQIIDETPVQSIDETPTPAHLIKDDISNQIIDESLWRSLNSAPTSEMPKSFDEFKFTDATTPSDEVTKQTFEFKTNAALDSRSSSAAVSVEAQPLSVPEAEQHENEVPVLNDQPITVVEPLIQPTQIEDGHESISEAQQQILANVLSQSVSHEAELTAPQFDVDADVAAAPEESSPVPAVVESDVNADSLYGPTASGALSPPSSEFDEPTPVVHSQPQFAAHALEVPEHTSLPAPFTWHPAAAGTAGRSSQGYQYNAPQQ